jgi:hypothetical protein
MCIRKINTTKNSNKKSYCDLHIFRKKGCATCFSKLKCTIRGRRGKKGKYVKKGQGWQDSCTEKSGILRRQHYVVICDYHS